jgi:hypothetical protein
LAVFAFEKMPRWTIESRLRQAETIRKTRPWAKSTGPRTEAGKARCARNPVRHGFRSASYAAAKREIMNLLRAQALRTKQLKLELKRRKLGAHCSPDNTSFSSGLLTRLFALRQAFFLTVTGDFVSVNIWQNLPSASSAC